MCKNIIACSLAEDNSCDHPVPPLCLSVGCTIVSQLTLRLLLLCFLACLPLQPPSFVLEGAGNPGKSWDTQHILHVYRLIAPRDVVHPLEVAKWWCWAGARLKVLLSPKCRLLPLLLYFTRASTSFASFASGRSLCWRTGSGYRCFRSNLGLLVSSDLRGDDCAPDTKLHCNTAAVTAVVCAELGRRALQSLCQTGSPGVSWLIRLGAGETQSCKLLAGSTNHERSTLGVRTVWIFC